MKSFKALLVGLVLGVLAVIGINASISFNQPVPATWSTPNGTNAFTLDVNANPVIKKWGTNYSGVSTNFALTNGASVTIKGGLIISVQ